MQFEITIETNRGTEGLAGAGFSSSAVGGMEFMMPKKKEASSFPLRLTPTMRLQIEHLAKREGVSLNQFINLAVAEKVMRMEGYSLKQETEASPINGLRKGVRKV